MATAAIPFINSQASGVDPLGGGAPAAINVIIEPTGATRRRPGLASSSKTTSTFTDNGGFPVELVGIYETEGGKLYAIGSQINGRTGEERILYRIDGGSISRLSNSLATYLIGDSRPDFAETEMLLVISGGSDMQKITLSDDVSSRLGGDPPKSSHVSAIASRLIANDVTLDKSNIRFSSVANGNTSYAGHEQWTQGVGTAGFFRAEARPDSVIALADNTNELFAWGASTTQIFTSDPSFVFTPVATKEVGLGAPYSIVKIDQSFAWLDDKRRFVVSDGRSFNVISAAIQRTLHDMGTVSDCFGYRVVTGPLDATIWTFPTDGRTFCYQKGEGDTPGGWSEWLCWDDALSNWTPFRANCHVMTKETKNLAGTKDGRIAELSLSANTDIVASGTATRVNASITTGYINHGTDALKHCKRVRFRMRRGQTTSSTAPVAFFSYRDDLGAFTSRIPISLGVSPDSYPVVEFHSLGSYRTRQWKFEFSDDLELVLLGATEEFDVLQN